MAKFGIRLCVTGMLCVWGSGAFGQDAAQLQKLYDDTLVQLQQSQDRKNQLANENARLTERVIELEAQIRKLRVVNERAGWMTAQYTAFRTFIQRYPALQQHFKQYPGSTPTVDLLPVKAPYEFFDQSWPFSAVRDELPAAAGDVKA